MLCKANQHRILCRIAMFWVSSLYCSGLRVQFLTTPCQIHDARRGTWTDIPSSASVFPVNIILPAIQRKSLHVNYKEVYKNQFKYINNFKYKRYLKFAHKKTLGYYIPLVRGSKGGVRAQVHRTTTYRCDDTRCCIIQFWPPDDEHNSARNM